MAKSLYFVRDHVKYQLNNFLAKNTERSETEEQLILFIFSPEDYWRDLMKFIEEDLKVTTEDLFIFKKGTAEPTVQFCLKKIV